MQSVCLRVSIVFWPLHLLSKVLWVWKIQKIFCDSNSTQGPVGPGCSLFLLFPNLPTGCCRLECSLFNGNIDKGYNLYIWLPNLPPMDCRPVVHPVYNVSELTSRGLFARVQPVYIVSETISRGC